MSIGKSSLARAAAASAPRAAVETASAQPTLAAREIETAAISLTKGSRLPAADEALLKSVREHGILEPLTVAQTPGGDLLLIAGARRLAAALALGLTTVPAVLVAMTAAQAASNRREIARFVAASTAPISATPEQPTAVSQAMPAWLL